MDKLFIKSSQKKLNSIKNMPNAIPYVTSYYQKDWGFCIQDSKRKN